MWDPTSNNESTVYFYTAFLFQDARVTAKERKEAKKMEKKKRAEERHRMKVGGMKTQFSDDEDVHTVITKDIAMMKI